MPEINPSDIINEQTIGIIEKAFRVIYHRFRERKLLDRFILLLSLADKSTERFLFYTIYSYATFRLIKREDDFQGSNIHRLNKATKKFRREMHLYIEKLKELLTNDNYRKDFEKKLLINEVLELLERRRIYYLTEPIDKIWEINNKNLIPIAQKLGESRYYSIKKVIIHAREEFSILKHDVTFLEKFRELKEWKNFSKAFTEEIWENLPLTGFNQRKLEEARYYFGYVVDSWALELFNKIHGIKGK